MKNIVLGDRIEIPICECGALSDAWAHDERNEDHHPFRQMKAEPSNGVYTVTSQGGVDKPCKFER